MTNREAPRLEFPILRALPRVAEFHAHPVTTVVCVAALGVTLASFADLDVSGLYFDVRFAMQPWRMVTSVLAHVNVIHLAFNLYWFWSFGAVIEEMLGSWRYLALIVAVAIGSAAAEHALFLGGVGLSGVVYAFFGFLWVNRGASERTLALLSQSTVRLFVAWFFVCIILTAAKIWEVGNVAHALGAALGLSIGRMHEASRWRRCALLTAIVAVIIVSLVAASLRPLVNLSPVRAAAVDGYRGYSALLKDRDLEAAMLLGEAVKLDDTVKASWINLGIAFRRLNHATLALDAYEHALALDPGDMNDRQSIAALYSSLGRAAQTSGRHKEAVRLLRRAVELQDDDPATWRALAVSLKHIGAGDEASAAARRAENKAP
jgi:membrane associated rhomboid family serine protease